MKFELDITRDELKKIYKKEYQKYNLIYAFVFLLVSFFIQFSFFKCNLLYFCLFYSLWFLLILLFFYGFTSLYVFLLLKKKEQTFTYGTYKIEITEKGIVEKVKNKKIELKFEDIEHIKKTKEYIFLQAKEKKNSLIFYKRLVKDEKLYEQIVSLLEKGGKK